MIKLKKLNPDDRFWLSGKTWNQLVEAINERTPKPNAAQFTVQELEDGLSFSLADPGRGSFPFEATTLDDGTVSIRYGNVGFEAIPTTIVTPPSEGGGSIYFHFTADPTLDGYGRVNGGTITVEIETGDSKPASSGNDFYLEICPTFDGAAEENSVKNNVAWRLCDSGDPVGTPQMLIGIAP